MDDAALRQEQISRERAQREAAQGRRAAAVLRGDLGPVLKRWVSASIIPTAERLRGYAEASLSGDLDMAASLLASPVFGIPQVARSRDLEPVLQWCLKGSSLGVAAEGTTYAEDLVLAVLGTAWAACAARDTGSSLTAVLSHCGDVARETALGQFIGSVQGAKALLMARRGKDHTWQQTKRLDAIAAVLGGQARSAIEAEAEISEAVEVGSTQVVTVYNQKGDARQITLRAPAPGDWKLMEMARKVRGEADPQRQSWMSFALAVICAAQAETGAFDLGAGPRTANRGRGSGAHKGAHHLRLSPAAAEALKVDLDKWLRLGFIKEPMLVVPENGDYLTVKHREVTGRAGPKGVKTDAKGTSNWRAVEGCLAATAWTVAADTLDWVKGHVGPPEGQGRRDLILGSYSRLAGREFYEPIYMDFRGRAYTRPTVVTYQGSDLQKGLLCFPDDGTSADDLDDAAWDAIILHLGALYGGPSKLGKASLREREEWYYAGLSADADGLCQDADEPVQLYTALSLLKAGQPNRMPCQIDGTCNGLQHLSALFCDPEGARSVNLCASTYEDVPNDIYQEVASRVADRVAALRHFAWVGRIEPCVPIDRSLCKKPVMVLPYGGQRSTVEEAAFEAVLDANPQAEVGGKVFCPWRECLRWDYVDHKWVRDEDAVKGNYMSFRERELKDHPLLHHDCKLLGEIIWNVIIEILPKAMEAMGTFRAIARAVGDRALEWSVPTPIPNICAQDQYAGPCGKSLWVVQAKPLSQKSTLKTKGLALPDSVRGLALKVGRDEIDPKSHVSGIVANFIHSQDGAHLAATCQLFTEAITARRRSMAFMSIHDCFGSRPLNMSSLNVATRTAFAKQYTAQSGNHPLGQPVRLRDITTQALEEFPSWHALAEACGVSFPAIGSWEPAEVLDSAWFFS